METRIVSYSNENTKYILWGRTSLSILRCTSLSILRRSIRVDVARQSCGWNPVDRVHQKNLNVAFTVSTCINGACESFITSSRCGDPAEAHERVKSVAGVTGSCLFILKSFPSVDKAGSPAAAGRRPKPPSAPRAGRRQAGERARRDHFLGWSRLGLRSSDVGQARPTSLSSVELVASGLTSRGNRVDGIRWIAA